MTDSAAVARLLQLASPMLPVGAYAYSQGLEAAIDDGLVQDAVGVAAWIEDAFELSLCRLDLPVLARHHRAAFDDIEAALEWNRWYLAARDTAELRAETGQTGHALLKLIGDLDLVEPSILQRVRAEPVVSFPLAYGLAARGWGIDERSTLSAFAWSWAENLAAVAMKAIPIGQVAAQRLLHRFGSRIADGVEAARCLPDDEIVTFLPGLSILSCRHETQYSRLFRS